MIRIVIATLALALGSSAQSAGELPVVGCKSDGQSGPRPAPAGTTQRSPWPFALYRAATGPGVIAPKGWHCFGTYGSGGTRLYLSPTPTEGPALASGAGIIAVFRDAAFSGRYDVAEAIFRYFPSRRPIAEDIVAALDHTAQHYPAAPEPGEQVGYLTDTLLRFTGRDCGGTPVHGIVALLGPNPDLIRISIRLPRSLDHLLPELLRLNAAALAAPAIPSAQRR